MAPAFSSARQAGAFALLLLFILCSPWLGAKWGLPTRDQVYSSISWRHGSFPYMGQQVFGEKGDVDMVFMGSSHIYAGIDTPYVQKQLSEKLGRPATVFTLGWNYSGYDSIYFFAKDLLEHRRVRLLVIYDDSAPNWPHLDSWRWVRHGENDEDIAGLSRRFRVSYYYGAILGMPRNILNRCRKNLGVDWSPDQFYRDYPGALFPPDRLGTMTTEIGYTMRQDLFEKYTPQTTVSPADVSVYGPDTASKFHFSDVPLPPLQTYFARKLLALTREHGAHLVCLSMPVVADQHEKAIPLSRAWVDCLRPDATLAGIVPERLFEGLSDAQVLKLYQDPGHLNENGKAYFTKIVTPKLVSLYEEAKP